MAKGGAQLSAATSIASVEEKIKAKEKKENRFWKRYLNWRVMFANCFGSSILSGDFSNLFLQVSKSQLFFTIMNSNCSNVLDLRNLQEIKKSILY